MKCCRLSIPFLSYLLSSSGGRKHFLRIYMAKKEIRTRGLFRWVRLMQGNTTVLCNLICAAECINNSARPKSARQCRLNVSLFSSAMAAMAAMALNQLHAMSAGWPPCHRSKHHSQKPGTTVQMVSTSQAAQSQALANTSRRHAVAADIQSSVQPHTLFLSYFSLCYVKRGAYCSREATAAGQPSSKTPTAPKLQATCTGS